MFSVYDLRGQRPLGDTDRLRIELNAIEPVLLTLSDKPIAPPSIEGPGRAHPGEIAEFHIGSNSPVKNGVIHVDVIDPDGSPVEHYSGNLLTRGPVTTHTLPLAFNDKTGIWKIRATDLPSGGAATVDLQVDP